MADIFFSTVDRSEVYQLPVLPEAMPELNRSASNEEFETYNNGTYNLIGNIGLYSFSLEGFLPGLNKKYPFAKNNMNPYLLVNMWARAMANKKPIRIIINRNKTYGLPIESLNILITVESMTHYEDKIGDVVYSVSFKEYREIK